MRYNLDDCIGELTALPGCSQVVVSHGVFVPTHKRGKGVGKKAHKARLAYIQDLGYDYSLCTVDSSNIAQKKILEVNGWKVLDSFVSSKTGHLVLLYGRLVSSPGNLLTQQIQQLQNVDTLN